MVLQFLQARMNIAASCKYTAVRYAILICILFAMNGRQGWCESNGNSGWISPDSLSVAEIERQLYDIVNEFRIKNGLSRLKWRDIIARNCRSHSRDMASGIREEGHGGVMIRLNAIKAEIPFSGSSENVAVNNGYDNPVKKAFDDWKNSPGHFKNLMGNYTHTGVGVARKKDGTYYFTQIYIYAPGQ